MPTEWTKATPKLEWIPERTYKRYGAVIICYRIPDYKKPKEHEDTPIFTISLDTVEHAKNIMEDIYYGEYTGA